MPDANLLVPGTQATTLRDQNGTTVYNAVRVSLGLQKKSLGGRPPSQWQDLLSLEYEPGELQPTRTSLLQDTHITPGPVVMTPYDRLPGPLATFPYDWRLDMRLNAAQLLDHLKEHKPAAGRWNLIGHSQGGIIIVLASQLTGDVHEFSRLVARVCLVGCPLAGTQRALEAMAVGRGDFGDEPFLYDAARGMAQTWPSLYQMLPAWASVLDGSGAPLPEAKQFTSIGGYPGIWKGGMSEDHLRRARETQALLEGPLSRFGPGVATLVIQGEKQDTPTWMTRTGAALATTGAQPGSRPELKFSMEPGDTLVPSEETLRWGGNLFRSRTLRLAGKVKEHAFLCDGKFVVKKIREFLAAPLALIAFLAAATLYAHPAPLEAQQTRVQLAGSNLLSDGAVHVLYGFDEAVDIGGDTCAPGGPVCTVPEWTFLAAAYGGIVVPEDVLLSIYAHVGIERKLTSDLSLGLLGFGFVQPLQGGAALRLDALDVGALKAGYGWGDDGGVLIGAEVAWEFILDLLR